MGGGSEGGVALKNCFNISRRALPENTLVSVEEHVLTLRFHSGSWETLRGLSHTRFVDPCYFDAHVYMRMYTSQQISVWSHIHDFNLTIHRISFS